MKTSLKIFGEEELLDTNNNGGINGDCDNPSELHLVSTKENGKGNGHAIDVMEYDPNERNPNYGKTERERRTFIQKYGGIIDRAILIGVPLIFGSLAYFGLQYKQNQDIIETNKLIYSQIDNTAVKQAKLEPKKDQLPQTRYITINSMGRDIRIDKSKLNFEAMDKEGVHGLSGIFEYLTGIDINKNNFGLVVDFAAKYFNKDLNKENVELERKAGLGKLSGNGLDDLLDRKEIKFGFNKLTRGLDDKIEYEVSQGKDKIKLQSYNYNQAKDYLDNKIVSYKDYAKNLDSNGLGALTKTFAEIYSNNTVKDTLKIIKETYHIDMKQHELYSNFDNNFGKKIFRKRNGTDKFWLASLEQYKNTGKGTHSYLV